MKKGFICWLCTLVLSATLPAMAGAADAPKDTDETPDLLELFKKRAEQRKKPYRTYRFSDKVKFHKTDAYDQKKEIDLGDVDDPKWAPEDHHHVFDDTPLPPGSLSLLRTKENEEREPDREKSNWFTPGALDHDESEGKSHLFEQPDAEGPSEEEKKHTIEKDTVSHIER